MKKTSRKSNLDVRRDLIRGALPKVRKLVDEFDLASVQSAVKMLYDERKASRELKEAEAKVASLRQKVGKK